MREAGKGRAFFAVIERPGRPAAEIVAEVLAAPLLDEDAFWQEKLVVLQEIQRAGDRQSILSDLFSATLWEAHPLRHPVLGSLEELQALAVQWEKGVRELEKAGPRVTASCRRRFRQEFVLPDHLRDLEGNLQDLIIMRCDLSVLCDGVELAGDKDR